MPRAYIKPWKNVAELKRFCQTKKQRRLIDVIEGSDTIAEVAEKMGVAKTNIEDMVRRIRKNAEGQIPKLTFDELPDKDIAVTELWEWRKKQYRQKQRHEEASKLINVRVNMEGPIGIWHCGDPHVDDDGTDLVALERHCDLVRRTDGLFGANIGDTTNNWIGRLARLYGEQGTTAAQAWKMAEYFLHFCPENDPAKMVEHERADLLKHWIYLIGGNHDCWSGAGDPLKWVLRQADAPYVGSQVRLNLQFPNTRECRINARHDFSGTSQWNPAHGAMKASQMGFHDHILVNGHKHKSGYGLIKDPANGTISHCIQIASYKVWDRFARERGFPDQHISPSVVTIIDPDADECGFVTVFHDIEEAVEFLTWKRRAH